MTGKGSAYENDNFLSAFVNNNKVGAFKNII